MSITGTPVALLYQAQQPPARNGILKPMKPGGYSDSGADIAYALREKQVLVSTPVIHPQLSIDLDWVFPDTEAGILHALAKGAQVLWLNTILYNGHPVEAFLKKGIAAVGQLPHNTDLYDDKWTTNKLLQKNNLPIPPAVLISQDNLYDYQLNFSFPVVAKPIRGRGSEGVRVANTQEELDTILREMLSGEKYGSAVYVEKYLQGQEVTITVMPPGRYEIKGVCQEKINYWSLPAVERFNHQNGIAPYNGTVAVVHNSRVLDDAQLQSQKIIAICKQCESAAALVGAKAPVRIDCRQDEQGNYFIFDLNMKPNMTGAARPHRQDQDSLSALAARKIGWSFPDLLINMLRQQWRM
ncbi:ATP-grasp domain-containing protein [Chitinophaga filiformis]|uniref:ATP-grasp domain-containing protein n=1 Tax=Chitinophaga filiformis TaxID=104663 RepID=UPI001F325FD8|nr:ATP-grasp domain-containing protein [Chitinophaga filiformis]